MNLKLAAIAIASLALLTACGGGGGGSAVTGTPEGVYEGNTSTNSYFNTIVLENNLYYTIYGTLSGNVFGVQGLIIGTGTANNGNFSSTNLKDFASNGTSVTGTLSASYVPNVNFNGSVSSGSSTVTFTAAPPANSNYNYNTATTPSNIVGAWSLTTLTGAPVSLTIASGGAYTATSSGCSFSGNFTPRASGKNVYDVSVNFGPSPCLLPNQSATAHAVEYRLANGQRQLIVAGTDVARNNATVLLGAR